MRHGTLLALSAGMGMLSLLAADSAAPPLPPVQPLPVAGSQSPASLPGVDDASWTSRFAVASEDWSSIGRNPCFILEPGYRLVLEHGAERLVVTVLDETQIIDGVETRVVEERETDGAELVEVSRNYFAISKRTNSVFYFGEDVDIPHGEGGEVSHTGSWRVGEGNASFGLAMSGQLLLKARYCQEVAPGIALDRAEIVALDDVMRTPAGEFKGCLKVEETTPLEPGVKEYKSYAPGIGLLRDGDLELVSYGPLGDAAK